MEMQRLRRHNANVAKEAEWHSNSKVHSAQHYQRHVIHMSLASLHIMSHEAKKKIPMHSLMRVGMMSNGCVLTPRLLTQ